MFLKSLSCLVVGVFWKVYHGCCLLMFLRVALLFRYADDSFTSAFVSTVGIDFKVKTVFRQDKRVKLQIWVNKMSIMLIVFLISTKMRFVWNRLEVFHFLVLENGGCFTNFNLKQNFSMSELFFRKVKFELLSNYFQFAGPNY
jgi:hypothetical protein